MAIIDPQQVQSLTGSNYPDLFKPVVAGREKKRLGDIAGLKNFGVNLTTFFAINRLPHSFAICT